MEETSFTPKEAFDALGLADLLMGYSHVMITATLKDLPAEDVILLTNLVDYETKKVKILVDSRRASLEGMRYEVAWVLYLYSKARREVRQVACAAA